jgi:hypothetical protein
MNQELRALYVDDQADRSRDAPPPDLVARDAARRVRVEELIDSGALETADDYYHAAMVFQHGGSLEHAWQAHLLARTAAELGSRGSPQWYHARWLAAAAYDSWLMHQGKPQKYGTQYQARDGEWELYQVDPTTSDGERAEWGVPPLHEAIARAHERTMLDPPRLFLDGLRLWPFSTRTRRVLAAANAEATELGHRFIGPEHVLLGILDDPGNSAARVIEETGATEAVRAKLIALLASPAYDAVQRPAPAWRTTDRAAF